MVLIMAEQDDLHSVIDAHIVIREADQQYFGLLNEAKSLHAQLQPVANALDRLQSDNATITDDCEEWLSLLRADALKPYLTIFYEAFQEAVTDNHFLTNLQHPKYKGNICLRLMKKLYDSCSQSFIQSIQKLLQICVHSPQVQTHFRLHFYHPHVLTECRLLCGGCVSNCKCKVSPPLISTALKLLHLPSSSAAIERVSSNFGLVQSKLWNQLGLEKAAKPVTCYRQLHGNAELNWIGNCNEHWNGPEQTMKYLDASLEFRVLCQLWLWHEFEDCIFYVLCCF